MGRRILRRHIWGYSVCLCLMKGTPGLNELIMFRIISVAYSALATMDSFCHLSLLALRNLKDWFGCCTIVILRVKAYVYCGTCRSEGYNVDVSIAAETSFKKTKSCETASLVPCNNQL